MAEFGQVFTKKMSYCEYADGTWSEPIVKALEPLNLHPAAHVLHYSSTCFEGLKAYKWGDGSIRLFRSDRNIERFRNSASALCLPVPSHKMLEAMIENVVLSVLDAIPDAPGSLYIRPTLIGTEPNIGAAGRSSHEAILYVLTAPVGDYFEGGLRPLKLLIDDKNMRSTPRFGQIKTGGNYAAALGSVVKARAQHNADQVLFCPNGQVQETGAANFIVIHDNIIITKKLDGTILAGITRDSILMLAKEKGYKTREIDYTVEQLLSWLPNAEAFLSGTAAVISPVGSIIYNDVTLLVGDGNIGKQSMMFKQHLTGIQTGKITDNNNWIKRLNKVS